MIDVFYLHAFESGSNLNERLQCLHRQIMQTIPAVDRIAVALYDRQDDRLRTFINSTRNGKAITGYQFPLSESMSLSALARSGQVRVIDEIQDVIKSNTKHSQWVLDQGYHSSFTVPIYDQGQLLGFVFYDSVSPSVFTPEAQRDLSLYTNLINLCIASEFATIKSIMSSIKVAREFAHLRDFETGKHLERMARVARLIGEAVADEYRLNDEFVEKIFLFAPLHDIGKIGIPDHILMKQGRLTPNEREVMKTHVSKGCEIVQRILGDFSQQHADDAKILNNIVSYHHELLDGSGYPNGLKGDEIPIEARITTVADIFDALSSKRHYKSVWDFNAAYDELKHMTSDGKLDAACVQAIGDFAETIQKISAEYKDLDSQY
jgi:HD-GYP domain-containing protein (c-di-GMP phosphodiesterase class II)